MSVTVTASNGWVHKPIDEEDVNQLFTNLFGNMFNGNDPEVANIDGNQYQTTFSCSVGCTKAKASERIRL